MSLLALSLSVRLVQVFYRLRPGDVYFINTGVVHWVWNEFNEKRRPLSVAVDILDVSSNPSSRPSSLTEVGAGFSCLENIGDGFCLAAAVVDMQLVRGKQILLPGDTRADTARQTRSAAG